MTASVVIADKVLARLDVFSDSMKMHPAIARRLPSLRYHDPVVRATCSFRQLDWYPIDFDDETPLRFFRGSTS